MKAKNFLGVLMRQKNRKAIAAAMLLLVFAMVISACGVKQTDSSCATPDAAQINNNGNLHQLYFKDSSKSKKVVAAFLNSASGESEEVEMKKCGEDSDSFTYSCEGDVKKYNVVSFDCDGKKTRKVAFNPCVSGWYRSKDGFLPYTQGEETDYLPHFEQVDFDCNSYEKKIFFWTPGGYDPDSEEKYATIYVLDGQGEVNPNDPQRRPDGCGYIPDQVRSMAQTTGYKAIVVAVSTYGDMTGITREDELMPDIGEYETVNGVGESKRLGGDFARFMAETLVPYVQEHYNVYTDALHTSVTGASLGGLETFYITLEYPELFGTAGIQSPSFWLYKDEVWRKYLSEKDFENHTPFLYLYTGPEGGDTDPDVTQMYNRLIEMGYPADRTVLHFNENGGHHPNFWCSYFSEYLSAMVYQSVEPLQGK